MLSEQVATEILCNTLNEISPSTIDEIKVNFRSIKNIIASSQVFKESSNEVNYENIY